MKALEEKTLDEIVESGNQEELRKYYEYLESMKTGSFYRDIVEDATRKICVASREYNVPLEINLMGVREKRHYPNEMFWKIVGEEHSPVTFGFDAQDVMSAYDGESLVKAKELVKKFNLNYIGKPTIIDIQKLEV